MRHCQFGYIFILTSCILIISLIGITGCINPGDDFVLADYEELSLKPPIELTIGQLHEEYITDPIAADDKYKWERLCFYEIEVEEVIDYGTSIKQYFITDNVKFILRSGSKMQNVEPGNILNLVGECRGFDGVSKEILTIKYCWAEGVNCDLGEDEPFNQY